MGDDWWERAVHEAAHAHVARRIGFEVLSISIMAAQVTIKPPPMPRSRRRLMTFHSAGQIAELMLAGRDTADAFDSALEGFFERLGDKELSPSEAQRLAAASSDEDVGPIALLVADYSTRARGMVQFRAARRRAVELLADEWTEVETLARKLIAAEPLPG